MGMLSKQELDVAVKVLEDKVEFIMKSFNVAQQSPILGVPPTVKSLLQVYYEVKAGVPLKDAVETPVTRDVAGELEAPEEVINELLGEAGRGSEAE